MNKWLLLLLIATLFTRATLGQTDLPKIIKPAPSTAELFKYQDYPMDYSTGIPQISIPIFHVTSGSLSVPISISYHASGRKVSDQDGPVGLGWSLNAGGMISRTIHSSVDFGTPTTGTINFPYPFKTDNLSNYNDIEYLLKIAHSDKVDCNILPWLDSEYDIFSYSFGNNSGKFFFNDNNGAKTPVLLPYKPFIITPSYTSSGLGYIDVIDDKGISYRFSPMETYSPASNSAISGWVLTQMISADKADTITFTYTSKNEQRRTLVQTATVIDAWQSNQQPYPDEEVSETEITTEEEYSTARLLSINFREGKILFNLINSDKIDNIQILNRSDEVIKTIQFTRSLCYSLSTTATNKLDAIVVKDKAGTAVENYGFEYYPVQSSNGQVNTRYCDWWGYYNNSGVDNFRPRYTNLPYISPIGGYGTISVGNPTANRNPDLEAMKSGVLKKITYPTGGSSEFVYEYNHCTQYGASGTPVVGPGLRLYQIKTSETAGGTPIIKTYKYGVNESGYGAIDLLPDITSMASESYVAYLEASPSWWSPWKGEKYRQRVFYSGFIGELSELAERPVIYTEVTEYQGTETSNIGKTIYKYDYNGWAPSGMPMFTNLTIPKKNISNYNYWNQPSLISKTDYKSIGSGTYQKVKEIANSYTVTVTENIRGLHVQPVWILPQTGVGSAYPPNSSSSQPVCVEKFVAWTPNIYLNSGYLNPFTFNSYQIPVGYKNLLATTETIYDNGTSVTNSIAYTYNSKQLQSQVSRSASNGNTIYTDIKYPFDYTGNSVLSQMTGLNMLAYPVEQIETKNATMHLKSVRTNYLNWGTTPVRIYPQTVEAKQGASSYEPRLRYHSYDDKGNVTAVSKENDIQKVYVWGYNKSYPVAEVVGITHAQAVSVVNDAIIQSSSTTDAGMRAELNKIRISFPSAQVITYTYRPLVGMTSSTDINNRTTYYEYDGFGRLSLIRDQNNKILKQFCYNYAGQVENCSITVHSNEQKSGTFTKQCSSGTGTSVTYTVPAGTYTSTINIEDANQKAQDDIDANGQAYANANGTCVTVHYNDALSGYYYSQNCGSNTPNAYWVSIAANTFSSTISKQDANNKATQDAQNQANTYGTCQSPSVGIVAYNSNAQCYWVEFDGVNGYYYFEVPQNTYYYTIGYVNAGTYNVTINSYCDYNSRNYQAGCSYSYGYGNAYFSPVTISSSCYMISIQ